MDSETPRWAVTLISWAPLVPFLVLIVVWFWLIRILGRRAKYMARSVEFMERHERLLERIAVALENRNKDLR